MAREDLNELSAYEKLDMEADHTKSQDESAKKDVLKEKTQKESAEKEAAEKEQGKRTDGKKTIKHEGMKGAKLIVFDGSVVEFDKDGVAELDAVYADYLLQIPSYEEM